MEHSNETSRISRYFEQNERCNIFLTHFLHGYIVLSNDVLLKGEGYAMYFSHCAALWLVCVGKCLLDSLPPRQECLPAFLHWLDENNVEHGSLKLEEIPGKGWGIVTTKDFNVCMYTCACDAHLRSVCLCVCDAHLPSVCLYV
jgi:hypothetical protein